MSHIKLKVPKGVTRAVIGSAHSLYWLNNYAWNARGNCDALRIGRPYYSADVEGMQEPAPYVGAAQIAKGLRLALESEQHAESAARVLHGRCDGPDCDIVLQFATFGAVLWG